jgi:plastocyanin
MRNSWLCFTGLFALAFFTAAGCGKSSQAPSSSNETSATAGVPVDAATAGSISGSVVLDGKAPKMKVINMAAEPSCAKEHSTPPTTQDALVGKDGALENVVVYLQGDFSKYKFDTPSSPATITQKECMYDPHVVVLQTAQTFQVVNSDPVTHNIHPLPKDNREWNESQPPNAAPIDQTFAHQEIPIPVKCNIHPWMKAYIAVFSHPYYAVTGPDGSFDLKNVPPGSYTLIAWHELYGTSQQPVIVGPREAKTLKITYQATAAGKG